MLRHDRAEIVDESRSGMSRPPSRSSMIDDDMYMWGECDGEERRRSTSSINTIIVCPEELDNEIPVYQLEKIHKETVNQPAKKSSPLAGQELDDRGMIHHIPVVKIHTCE